MKRITLVCQYYYPEKVSSSILPYELASELAKEYDVRVLCGYPKEYSDETKVSKNDKINNVTVKRIKYLQLGRKNIIGRILNIFSFCLAVVFKSGFLRKSDKVIVYTNPPLLPFTTAVLKKLYKYELYNVVYDVYPDVAVAFNVMSENGRLKKIYDRANNYTYKRCTKILTLCNEMKELFVNNKNCDPNKVAVIPNWYVNDMTTRYVPNKRLKVLYGGNMGVAQDMQTILDTILLLKDEDIQFAFAGHGCKKDEVQAFIDSNNLKNVEMYGFLDKQDYEKLMETCDIYIVSLDKLSYRLGSPSKFYSYLSMGRVILAIINKDSDIAKDINEYKCGYAIDNDDSEHMAQILKTVTTKQLSEMAINARNLFEEKYTLVKSVEKFKEELNLNK